MPHEEIGKDGSVSWFQIGAGVIWEGIRWEKTIQPVRFRKILHQTRHPLSTLSSALTLLNETKMFLSKHIDKELPDWRKEPLAFLMAAWVEWNKKIEPLAPWRYKLEDFSKIWPEFKRQTGLPEESPLPDIKNKASRKSVLSVLFPWRSRYLKTLSWKDLRKASPKWAEEVRKLAETYGYSF